MALENASHIDELNASSPLTSDDPFGANAIYLELQQLKTVLTTDWGNISGAVTTSDVQMNYLDVATLGTAESSKALTVSAGDAINGAILTWSNLGAVTTVDINGGSVDATAIGANSASTGAFTTIAASGAATLSSTLAVTGAATLSTSLVLASGATVTAILDEDAMGTDSATALATQQSIKAYVDNASYATEAYADARGFYVVNVVIPDISTSDIIYVPMSMAGIVTRVDSVLGGTIITADPTVELKTSTDQVMAVLHVAYSGSGAGDVDSDTSINQSTVAAGTYLKLTTGGESGNVVPLYVSILVDIS